MSVLSNRREIAVREKTMLISGRNAFKRDMSDLQFYNLNPPPPFGPSTTSLPPPPFFFLIGMTLARSGDLVCIIQYWGYVRRPRLMKICGNRTVLEDTDLTAERLK